MITWRHDFHQNPELGNRETRTAAIIAKHLRALGIEVQPNVAVTGVVGLLKGGLPGPVIALRPAGFLSALVNLCQGLTTHGRPLPGDPVIDPAHRPNRRRCAGAG